ncbi:Basic pentacysteine1 [Thalictrum thalictroides]|uniref:GAGA-binding transcriptional activator n=1 Tax=Thalictrum thalictroides TaxID=46969 RepID=A0A7J6XCS7_THATH|nr:Basic pentacysteine1 [Thalictrum thalictroides]
MDDDSGLGIRNWGYYEPSLKGNLGLQLMSNVQAERDTKPFFSGREFSGRDPSAIMVSANGNYHNHRDCGIPESSIPMDFMRDGWLHQREKFLHVLPGNPNYSLICETSGSQPLHMLQSPDSSKDERMIRMEEPEIKKDGPLKKRPGGRTQKSPKTKKSKKAVPKDETNASVQRAKPGKRNTALVINGIDFDISGIPIPVCSCTGIPQQCYRWGCGGWQSACCTTSISVYPLPMSTKRRGARIAGRKMSQGAFKKVLEKLAAEGYNLSNPIDLRTHWAKHGTNKFVTIR